MWIQRLTTGGEAAHGRRAWSECRFGGCWLPGALVEAPARKPWWIYSPRYGRLQCMQGMNRVTTKESSFGGSNARCGTGQELDHLAPHHGAPPPPSSVPPSSALLSQRMMFARTRGRCGPPPLVLPVAARLLALLAALTALQLSTGLASQPQQSRRALLATAAGSQLLPPPQLLPPQLLRRNLLPALAPPRRMQRRPSRLWWEALEPLWADEFAGSVLDSSKW